ncbi:MAG: hypothetical protein MI745_04635 [Pseudomonadales bacterium]|nr:hypothetical protein [Pseudomonadales bacterium]
MKSLSSLIAVIVLASGLFLTPVSTLANEDSANKVHPAIQEANEHREKEKRRKRYLLLFPAAVVGITVALIVVTRRRK